MAVAPPSSATERLVRWGRHTDSIAESRRAEESQSLARCAPGAERTDRGRQPGVDSHPARWSWRALGGGYLPWAADTARPGDRSVQPRPGRRAAAANRER